MTKQQVSASGPSGLLFCFDAITSCGKRDSCLLNILYSALCVSIFAGLLSVCVALSPLVIILLTDPRRCFFCGYFCYLCLTLPYYDVCFLQPCGHLLGKGWPLYFLVCDVYLCFCLFPICCPGSGVVLYCIDS